MGDQQVVAGSLGGAVHDIALADARRPGDEDGQACGNEGREQGVQLGRVDFHGIPKGEPHKDIFRTGRVSLWEVSMNAPAVLAEVDASADAGKTLFGLILTSANNALST
ncbi:hypothetical protein CNECB9_3050001 [Cupriavidus necator]|uniref:Uncharacterized protein n=1 Tax=Cupriavidus necator TaxID=106590 RepID=A0A1K0ITS9_CUPNE|nr:hypothetical protein CNECB9_3050001 [Cupriavidus necator]